MESFYEKYDHPIWKDYKNSVIGGHNGIDALAMYAFLDAVRRKVKPPIDVYDCAAWMKTHSKRVLTDARKKREEQLEARGELWSGIAMLGLAAAAATATAVAAHEAQKSSLSGTTSYSASGSSSYSSSSSDDDRSTSSAPSASSSSSGQKCGVCGGKGYTIEYASTFGLNDEKYCSECGKNVPAGHYHQTCTYCGGDGVR